MEDLRRCTGDAHLYVVFCAQLQKPLKPRGRMLGPLPLISVWQKHSQATETIPLVLTTGDELIYDNLCAVSKIAKLRLPHNESGGRGRGVSVLKGQCSLL